MRFNLAWWEMERLEQQKKAKGRDPVLIAGLPHCKPTSAFVLALRELLHVNLLPQDEFPLLILPSLSGSGHNPGSHRMAAGSHDARANIARVPGTARRVT
jgi:hypothetical protein